MTSAPGNGGRRRGAGRPVGSSERVPRPPKKNGPQYYERVKSMVQQYEDAEFLVTNVDKIFKGNAREFLVSVYQAESLPVRVRVYAACKVYEIEPPPAIRTPGSPDAGEALVQAILRLKFDEDVPQGPPPQIIPPALPRPTVRPRSESPIIDGVSEGASDEPGGKSGGNAGDDGDARRRPIQFSHTSAPEGQDLGADSEPEAVDEISAEEGAYVASLPPHLRPAKWQPK